MIYVLIRYVDNEYPTKEGQFTNWDEAVNRMVEEIRECCEDCDIDMYDPEFGVDNDWIYKVEPGKGCGFVYDGDLNYTWSIIRVEV